MALGIQRSLTLLGTRERALRWCGQKATPLAVLVLSSSMESIVLQCWWMSPACLLAYLFVLVLVILLGVNHGFAVATVKARALG